VGVVKESVTEGKPRNRDGAVGRGQKLVGAFQVRTVVNGLCEADWGRQRCVSRCGWPRSLTSLCGPEAWSLCRSDRRGVTGNTPAPPRMDRSECGEEYVPAILMQAVS
jgi:hypothetical protein